MSWLCLKYSRSPTDNWILNPDYLTTHVPVRAVYLTSGKTRKLTLGKQIIELQHAPSWQLTFAKEPAGEIVRALAWAGPERVERGAEKD